MFHFRENRKIIENEPLFCEISQHIFSEVLSKSVFTENISFRESFRFYENARYFWNFCALFFRKAKNVRLFSQNLKT
jgi:hypothetical protein